ncbi:hypothetical protein [Halobaculum litoreum]|uniref:Nmd3 N-terminal domain-containing protein n=1 Tax=Halobaculum litoreum TaxID=3031998 RepID=A0ABD5XJR4_9EURY|nr:hypothetical protein [Halobaculum sp. DT92]
MTDVDVTAGVGYVCRICGNEQTVRVYPVVRDDGATVDTDSRHRLVQAGCPRCGERRTHVAAVTLAGRGEKDAALGVALDGGTADRTLTLDGDGLEVPADVDVSDGVVFRARGATVDVKPRGADRDRYPLIDRRSLEADGRRVVNEGIGIREVTVKPYGEDARTYRVEVAEDGGDGR